MLTTLRLLRRRAAAVSRFALAGCVVAGGAALGLAAGGAGSLRADPAPRPPDLVLLQERTTLREGTHWLGVYGRQADPEQPGVWRIRLWREWSDRVEIGRETLDCRPGQAARAGVSGGRLVVQTLNPGGLITPANRLDHLIWWATCFPELAGRDPAALAGEARRRGFDGQQPERFEVLPGTPQAHP